MLADAWTASSTTMRSCAVTSGTATVVSATTVVSDSPTVTAGPTTVVSDSTSVSGRACVAVESATVWLVVSSAQAANWIAASAQMAMLAVRR